MRTTMRTHGHAPLIAACALAGAALALIAGGFGSLARGAEAAGIASTPASTLAAPFAPVSVTWKRSFTVTAAVVGAPGDAASSSVACYRLGAHGAWSLGAASRGSLHATGSAAGAPYVSATVSLPATGTWVLRAVCGTDSASESPTSTRIRVGSHADRIVWNRDGHLTWPERMAYRGDATQMIVATAASLGAHSGTVTVYEYRDGDWVNLFGSACRFGRHALRDGTKRHRGDLTTPTGIWQMPGYVFGMHRAKLSGTKLAYRHITSHTWWSAEKGAYYNTWITRTRHVDGERLADAPVQYEYALSTGYNAKPNTSVYGRGTGIFFHVWKNKARTAGCVAVPRAIMRRVFRTLNPKVRRVFAVGTTAKTGATSINAY